MAKPNNPVEKLPPDPSRPCPYVDPSGKACLGVLHHDGPHMPVQEAGQAPGDSPSWLQKISFVGMIWRVGVVLQERLDALVAEQREANRLKRLEITAQTQSPRILGQLDPTTAAADPTMVTARAARQEYSIVPSTGAGGHGFEFMPSGDAHYAQQLEEAAERRRRGESEPDFEESAAVDHPGRLSDA
jgi:hypothetical protein